MLLRNFQILWNLKRNLKLDKLKLKLLPCLIKCSRPIVKECIHVESSNISLTVIPYSRRDFDVMTAVIADVKAPTRSEFKPGPISIQKIPINFPINDLGVISPYLNKKSQSSLPKSLILLGLGRMPQHMK